LRSGDLSRLDCSVCRPSLVSESCCKRRGEIIQRELLAAAVALACALPARLAAQADEELSSAIQIYGRVNVTLERIGVSGRPSDYEVVDNTSRLGVRGGKDLGRGLRALFQIESRIRLDTGGAVLASRPSYAGLQGAFGTARFGRVRGPVYRFMYEYISLHNHNSGNSTDAFVARAVRGNQEVMDNLLWYTSPRLGPITAHAAYSLLREAPLPGMSQPRNVGLVVAYDEGPLHLAASHADTRSTSNLGGGTPNQDQATTIRCLYRMRAVVVGALFERAASRLLADEASRNYFRVSTMVPVAKHEFHVNLGQVNHRLDAKLSDDGAVQWTLGYNYNITKETKVYTFYTTVNNDDKGNYGFKTNTPGVDNKSAAVGVRHNF